MAVDDQGHLLGAADVEVVADGGLEPRAALARCVEHRGVGNLQLAHGELVGEAAPVVGGEGAGGPAQPPLEEVEGDDAAGLVCAPQSASWRAASLPEMASKSARPLPSTTTSPSSTALRPARERGGVSSGEYRARSVARRLRRSARPSLDDREQRQPSHTGSNTQPAHPVKPVDQGRQQGVTGGEGADDRVRHGDQMVAHRGTTRHPENSACRGAAPLASSRAGTPRRCPRKSRPAASRERPRQVLVTLPIFQMLL